MTLRPGSAGFGPGLTVIAQTAAEFDVRPGPHGAGTHVAMTFDVPLDGPGPSGAGADEPHATTSTLAGAAGRLEPGAAADADAALGDAVASLGSSTTEFVRVGDEEVAGASRAPDVALTPASPALDGAGGGAFAGADGTAPAAPVGPMDLSPISDATPARTSERLVVALVVLGLLAWVAGIVLVVRLL